MKKATVIYINYEESDKISCQGTRAYVQRHLDNGYYVQSHRNGNWVLVKPARVSVLLEDEDGERGKFNIKQDIAEYYGAKRISPKLVDRFIQECEDERISFYMENNQFCFE